MNFIQVIIDECKNNNCYNLISDADCPELKETAK